jgi:hypothetical protein
MKPVTNEILSRHDGHVAVNKAVDFILELIRFEDGFEDFSLPDPEWHELVTYLTRSDLSPITGNETPDQFRKITLDGLKFLKRRQEYKDHQIQRDRKRLLDALDEHNIPREQFADITDPANNGFQPKDCAALQDWPERRQPADGEAGRLENAGQFIQRLFAEKLYDEKKFGKLYLFELRTINPKLYQALVQWQKRTGNKLLANKQDEIDALLHRSETESLDFLDTSRVSNARWRKQQATQS